MKGYQITRAQYAALERAARRESRCICPIRGVHAAAETSLIRSLVSLGFCTDSQIPQITDLGLAALDNANQHGTRN